MPVLPQKLERIASYARVCLLDPGLTAEVFLPGYCPKMKYVSALEARINPNPALTGRACGLENDVWVRMAKGVWTTAQTVNVSSKSHQGLDTDKSTQSTQLDFRADPP